MSRRLSSISMVARESVQSCWPAPANTRNAESKVRQGLRMLRKWGKGSPKNRDMSYTLEWSMEGKAFSSGETLISRAYFHMEFGESGSTILAYPVCSLCLFANSSRIGRTRIGVTRN